MERFVKGDVVVLLFPFSDLSGSKKRPALVIANILGDDLILCQITSTARIDDYSIFLGTDDFIDCGLQQTSLIRPNKIFTADKSIISYRVGHLSAQKIKEAEEKLIKIFQQ